MDVERLALVTEIKLALYHMTPEQRAQVIARFERVCPAAPKATGPLNPSRLPAWRCSTSRA